MEHEKKVLGGWWMWILFLVVITIAVLGFTGTIGKWFGTTAEHYIFENSHQYQESQKRAVNTMDAESASLQAQLANPNLTEADRVNINAQLNAINILKRGKM